MLFDRVEEWRLNFMGLGDGGNDSGWERQIGIMVDKSDDGWE